MLFLFHCDFVFIVIHMGSGLAVLIAHRIVGAHPWGSCRLIGKLYSGSLGSLGSLGSDLIRDSLSC